MSPRMKILVYICFGGLMLFQASEYIQQSFVSGPKEKLESSQKKLEEKILDYEKVIHLGKKANRELPHWEKQALPENVDRASALYKNWLLQLVSRAGLASTNVEANSSVSTKKGAYRALSFSVRGKGNLEQLTALLYEFYQTNLLHRINSLSLTPSQSSDQIDISLGIEALSMAGVKRDHLITEEPSERLAYSDVLDYRPIIKRNFFSVGGEFDPVNLTRLSGITYSSLTGQPEAWFTLGATDERVELKSGEELTVGDFTGKIVQIAESDVILESGGSKWLLSIGENLDQAYAIPASF
ncbi:hypothetical protein Pla110_35380 [Polystyrenella longa]|uniref:Uncharacterized protein n=1 Tax=Polystyrenella longa TaxID=2528007 RepID=A0A518CRE5_9PLAN|nr:hypothetical protein [Polystyrenella longa]QDU81788.1 hypothetical protein Pla110_35380 [Polystyrenella longa]